MPHHIDKGEIKDVCDWPEAWRKGLVTRFETQDRYDSNGQLEGRKESVNPSTIPSEPISETDKWIKEILSSREA